MKKFMVFALTSSTQESSQEQLSQEEQQAVYKKWFEWKEELGELLVSLGSPLVNGKQINASGIQEQEASNIAGYMIIQANDLEHAIELLNKSPLFGDGTGQNFEIFEIVM